MVDNERSDEELARQVSGGDDAGFANLHRRHFSRVYDFALRLTRDRDTAALVVQSSFLGVYRGLRSGEAQAPFKLQLFANAHHDVHERLRRRRGPVLEGEEAFAAADPSRLPDPSHVSELPELARLAWQATRGMKLDEYELLDLNVRQQLDPAQTAAVLRIRQEALESRIQRVHDAFEESFSALLLVSRGRQECLDLDFLVGDAEWSASLRRRALRHLRTCEACQGTRRRLPSAAEVYATLMPVPAPSGWEDTILSRLQKAVRPGTGPAEAAPAVATAEPAPTVATAAQEPLPRAREVVPQPVGRGGGGFRDWMDRYFGGRDTRGPLVVVLGGGLVVVAIALGALCGAGAFDGGGAGAAPTQTATLTGTPTGTATATATSTTTITATMTPLPPSTDTPVPPTSTEVPPTLVPATATAAPATPTPNLPTATTAAGTPTPAATP